MSLDATRLPNQTFVSWAPTPGARQPPAVRARHGAARRKRTAGRAGSALGRRAGWWESRLTSGRRVRAPRARPDTSREHTAPRLSPRSPATSSTSPVRTSATCRNHGLRGTAWGGPSVEPPPPPFLLNPGCGARTEASPDGGVGVGDFVTSGCVSALRKQSVPIPHLYFQSAGCLTRLRPCLRCSGGREMPSTVRKSSPNSVKSNHHTSWSLFSIDQKPSSLFSI